MRQKRPQPQHQKLSSNKITQAVNGAMAMDAFQNLLARTGIGTTSMMEGTNYVLDRMTRNYNLLNALYRGNWIVRRVVDVIPKAMCKNWLTYTADLKPEELDKLKKLESVTRLKRSILQGLKLGRLYGGAGGIILLEGQHDLEEPLDVESIYPGDFKGLMVVDRWQGIYPQTELISDLGSPEIGLPEFYQFQNPASLMSPSLYNYGNVKVHHSRVIRFVGDDLPNWEWQAEQYWGASKLEAVYEELKKRDNMSANIAGLTFLASLRILKMGDLGETMALGNDSSKKDFYNTLKAQNELMNNFGLYVMSKEDEFQNFQYSFGGMAEIYETFKSDMAGACDMPVTMLFGTSPGGLNATGESDQENFSDVVEEAQEEHLRPAMEKLLPVISMSALGYVVDDLDFILNPFRTSKPDKMAEVLKSKSETIYAAHDRGLISDQTAMKELKISGEESGTFSSLTDEIINAADDEPHKEGLALEGSEADPEELDKLK